MAALLALSRAIDEIGRRTSTIATWLVLLAALVSAFNAFFRYSISSIILLDSKLRMFGGGLGVLFNLYRDNSNSLRDVQLIMFAGMVMLGTSWTLRMNEHVRVDIIYGSVSPRTRCWIDLTGAIFFLVPMCVVLFYFSWPWFLDSWVSGEMSVNAGGLPRWLFKLFLPLGFALLLLQALSEIIKCVAELTTAYRRGSTYEKPVQ
ncbi:MAG TPA: TRAP transporter small permease subunit [Aestuariivirga sp.]|nr:TRAP transporter small permease subunit [Aestuariivirga sp.]